MDQEQNPNENLAEFGILNPDACDAELRSRVLTLLLSANQGDRVISKGDANDLATYITQLEDALLRYHWGGSNTHQINELLKCSTGLDIEARASELNAMTASDA